MLARRCFGTRLLAHHSATARATMAMATPPPKHRELSPPAAPRGKIGTGMVLVEKLKIIGITGDTIADSRSFV